MADPAVDSIHQRIDKDKSFFASVSKEIWEHPELCFEERFAHDLLTDALRKEGFDVRAHYVLETAFRAEFSINEGPTIAILCEYDALPKIGHACGHNLIAEAGLAAGFALKAALQADPTVKGKVVVLGTPAEEGGGGKIKMIQAGVFDDIDVAMMVHPTFINKHDEIMNAICQVSVKYKGRAAHAAGCPWEGLNALDASVAAYSNVALLRQQISPNCKVHGIICNGGDIANVIPEETELSFFIRAPDVEKLKALDKRVYSCFKAAAEATGCTLEVEYETTHENLAPNPVLANLYKKHAESMGVEFEEGPTDIRYASTDMGNVTQVIPSIHPFYAVPTDCFNHTRGFTKFAGSPGSQDATLVAAKAMALSSLDVLRNHELLSEIKKAFMKDRETKS